MFDKDVAATFAIAWFVILVALMTFVLLREGDRLGRTNAQAKLWECTLDPAYRESGKAWKSYHLASTYEAARKLTAERMQWDDEAFTVSPCVKNYQDTLNVVLQP